MIKKQYIQPETKIVMIAPRQMLAASLGLGGSQDNNDALGRESDDEW
ncbi:MAG: hypothetical protein IJV17_06100 [Prevotella sp.]|nr:hypothetical protein [Prevotella sp.]